MNGKFIISLDFELRWGAAEKWPKDERKEYFLKTRKSIPKVLEIFEKNNIRATWATVGFLFAENKQDLLSYLPSKKPQYMSNVISSYKYIHEVGKDEKEDPLHFAYSLITLLKQSKGQEIGTHTFSHYYCIEEGQTIKDFEADLIAAQKIAKEKFDIELKSLVFPRNQYNQNYLEIASKCGIKTVRSNPDVWFWKNTQNKLNSIFRGLDTLTTISSTLCFKNVKFNKGVIEVPASRFFRPYNVNEKWIQKLKINRIKKEMTYAAKNGLNYHLWWHPHNFANDIDKNIHQLQNIIDHYRELNSKYDFKSQNMGDLVDNEII